MASINKKDLRLLNPGELVMARQELALVYGRNPYVDSDGIIREEDEMDKFAIVNAEMGEVLLVLKDYRKTANTMGPRRVLQFLYGEKIVWLQCNVNQLVSKYIKVVVPPNNDIRG